MDRIIKKENSIVRKCNSGNSYKDYCTKSIGASDISCLVLAGCSEKDGFKLDKLDFGEDGSYYAYIVDKAAEIGSHYNKVAEFYHWLKIYDDFGLTFSVYADKVIIYRAGAFGCIIQIIK